MSISKHAEQRHKIAGKSICDGLVIGFEFDAWDKVTVLLGAHLSTPELAMIARAALKALPDDAVNAIFDAVVPVPDREPTPAHVTEAAIEYRRQTGLTSFNGVRT